MPVSNRTKANRENAKKSTGPITVPGKQRASGNARTHGLTSAVIPPTLRAPGSVHDPTSDEFQILLDIYVADYGPANQAEFDLLRTLASQQWQLRRADAYIEEFSRDLHTKDPLLVSRVLENFTKQQARVQRAYNQTLALFGELQFTRLAAQQAQIDNATRIYKHMIDQEHEDLATWQPSDDGFDFSLFTIQENLEQWDFEAIANRDFKPPKFTFRMILPGNKLLVSSNPEETRTPEKRAAVEKQILDQAERKQVRLAAEKLRKQQLRQQRTPPVPSDGGIQS